jgi:NTE family protein
MAKRPSLHPTHRIEGRPPFERIALILQGGGALGAYQGGVYQALDEAGVLPDCVAGISIGAVNAALIAGNAPKERLARLRAFWEEVSRSPLGIPPLPTGSIHNDILHRAINQSRALAILFLGAPGFFAPRLPPPYLMPPGLDATSFYEVDQLKGTLGRLVDFDRINSRETRLVVGAVNVRSGNFVYFDNEAQRIGPEHILASGALPPGFPATEIDGEYYWDGGLVSNTPLQWVLDSRPRLDTLAFQVDLWCAQGELPRTLVEVNVREKEIRYSSRTRAATDQFRTHQRLRHAVAHLAKKLPKGLRSNEDWALLAAIGDEKVYNIIELIYHARSYEGVAKDFEFSHYTMEEHWQSGYEDAVRTLRHPEVLERPTSEDGVLTFDINQDGRDR